jgi:pyrimidine 5'-nucleotidase
VWLFDLDDTLHTASYAIFPAIHDAMMRHIIETLQVTPDAANHLRDLYTRRYGAALLGLIRHHGIDAHHFLRVAHTFDDLPAMLRAERGLARHLAALPGRRWILTNGPSAYAQAVLEALGIARLFERVIAIEQMRDRRGAWRAKPDRAMLRRTLRTARVPLARAILVDDTRTHLKSYRQLGIGTVWFTGHTGKARPRGGRPHYIDQRITSIKSLRHKRYQGQI